MDFQRTSDDDEQARLAKADPPGLWKSIPRELRDMIASGVGEEPGLICFRFQRNPEVPDDSKIAGSVPFEIPFPYPSPIVYFHPQIYFRANHSTKVPTVIKDESAKYTNREGEVSRDFRDNKDYQKTLSQSGYVDSLLKVHGQTLAEEEEAQSQSDSPAALEERMKKVHSEAVERYLFAKGDRKFVIEIDGRLVTPRVRREVDWFYIPGFLECWHNVAERKDFHMPFCWFLTEVRNMVMDLTDLYRGLCLNFGGERERNPDSGSIDVTEPPLGRFEREFVDTIYAAADPDTSFNYVRSGDGLGKADNFLRRLSRGSWFLFQSASASMAEELRVLVGPLPDPEYRLVQNTEEVVVEWSSRGRGIGESHIATKPDNVSGPDKHKISLVKYYLEDVMKHHKDWISNYLRSDESKIHRDSAGPPWTPFGGWLSTMSGRWWLDTDDGKEWLRSTSAKWWLSCHTWGVLWLDSTGGLAWLNSADGQEFLGSDFALQWAELKVPGIGGRRIPGDKREWLKTKEGERWFAARSLDGSFKRPRPQFADPPRAPMHADYHPRTRYYLPSYIHFISPSRLVFIQFKKEFTEKAKARGTG